MGLVLSWKFELNWPNGTAGLGIGKLMWGSSAEPTLLSLQNGSYRT